MKRTSTVALLWLVSTLGVSAGEPVPGSTQDVDQFIGTRGTGHVFPGAVVPFGMVQPGPDNADSGWSYSSGYQYDAPRILGFSNSHISGAGIPELGDVLMMPNGSAPWTVASTRFDSAYRKQTETAQPGHYAVRLDDRAVYVALTAGERVAYHRYIFDRPGRVQVLVDLQHGLRFKTTPRVTAASHALNDDGLVATVHASNWVDRQTSVALHFDHPIVSSTRLPAREGEKAPRLVLEFDLGAGRVLEARVALSTVDEAGAAANLDSARGVSFDRARYDADRAWNALLSRVAIDAPPRQRRIVYSALYRTMIHPSQIADVDGRVRGPDGEVIAAPGGVYYSTLSLWDTFRATQPLLTLVASERVPGIVATLLAYHRAQGYLPLWTAWGRETHTMIGNPALPVLAEAAAKGLAGDAIDAVLDAMVETSTAPRPSAPAWAQRDWSAYDTYGYIPYDRIPTESVSKTLELGIGDDAVARVARLAGRHALAERFERRAAGWEQLWDEQTRVMRGRDSAGRWRTPFDPLVPTSPMNNPGDYTEANAWQYTLTPALHDPEGLIRRMGGTQAFEAWLDRFFSIEGAGDNKHLGQEAMIGQYAHGNEPSHHIAYLYAWTDAPDKGHALVRRIAQSFYGDGPDGIIGNDDCGQMSAWLVLSTLGIYPVVPASAHYVAGVPLVPSAALQLTDGGQLRIRRGTRDGAWIDGKRVDRTALSHHALLRARTLELGPAP